MAPGSIVLLQLVVLISSITLGMTKMLQMSKDKPPVFWLPCHVKRFCCLFTVTCLEICRFFLPQERGCLIIILHFHDVPWIEYALPVNSLWNSKEKCCRRLPQINNDNFLIGHTIIGNQIESLGSKHPRNWYGNSKANLSFGVSWASATGNAYYVVVVVPSESHRASGSQILCAQYVFTYIQVQDTYAVYIDFARYCV